MSQKIFFLQSAEQDLKELRDYLIKNFGKPTWQDSYSKIKESIQTLQTYPLKGNIPEELHNLNLTQYRQIISGMNRIIYEIRQQAIYIHLICDTRKDIKAVLTKRLLRVV